MSGLVKAKKYNWKDSNIAMFGSDTDRDVKKKAAEKEHAWKMAGKKPGLQIWRINKFKVETWPTDEYGNFYNGDSYVILNTYKDEESDKLLYDVHFWIGKFSTQDEYGTAAYKTVELDTLLDDVPVQHREVQGHESSLFKSYFREMVYLEGGADSGFRHVEETKYKPRLIRVTNRLKPIQARQVNVRRDQLRSDDAFILDDGKKFFQFNGKTASKQECYTAAQVLSKLTAGRPKSEVETVDEEMGGQPLEDFYAALEKVDTQDDDDDDDDMQQQMEQQQEESSRRRNAKLFKLSDAEGELKFKEMKEGDINKKDFASNDVFILDSPTHGVFVWIGCRASENEKANGLGYAHKYLSKTLYPCAPVTCLKEGQSSCAFKAAIAA